MHEAHAALLAHFGLDAVLGFQLLDEFFGREAAGEDVALAFDGGEVARAQRLQLVQPAFERVAQARGVANRSAFTATDTVDTLLGVMPAFILRKGKSISLAFSRFCADEHQRYTQES